MKERRGSVGQRWMSWQDGNRRVRKKRVRGVEGRRTVRERSGRSRVGGEGSGLFHHKRPTVCQGQYRTICSHPLISGLFPTTSHPGSVRLATEGQRHTPSIATFPWTRWVDRYVAFREKKDWPFSTAKDVDVVPLFTSTTGAQLLLNPQEGLLGKSWFGKSCGTVEGWGTATKGTSVTVIESSSLHLKWSKVQKAEYGVQRQT